MYFRCSIPVTNLMDSAALAPLISISLVVESFKNQCPLLSPLLGTEEAIPLTSSLAVVLPAAVWQLYSPASARLRSRMISVCTLPSCWILHLWLGWITDEPFFHSTGTSGLDTSQDRWAVPPSCSSRLCRAFTKVTGAAVGRGEQHCCSILTQHHPQGTAGWL